MRETSRVHWNRSGLIEQVSEREKERNVHIVIYTSISQ